MWSERHSEQPETRRPSEAGKLLEEYSRRGALEGRDKNQEITARQTEDGKQA